FPTEMYAGRKQTHAARTQSVIKQMLMPSAIVRRASRGTKQPASAKKSTSVSSLTRAHTIARTRKDLLNVRAIGTIKRSTATVWQKDQRMECSTLLMTLKSEVLCIHLTRAVDTKYS
ncbi:hypothetical protein CRUP_033570, partial [Coryphaenoides rupestris]